MRHNLLKFNPFTPTHLYGIFQIKVWTIPMNILSVGRVKENDVVILHEFLVIYKLEECNGK